MYSLRSRTEEEDAFVLVLALVSDHIEGRGVLDYRDSEGVKERLVQGVEDGVLGVDSGDDLYGEDLVLVFDSFGGYLMFFVSQIRTRMRIEKVQYTRQRSKLVHRYVSSIHPSAAKKAAGAPKTETYDIDRGRGRDHIGSYGRRR